MNTSTRGITKIKRRKRPDAPGTPVVVRLQPDLLTGVDGYIAHEVSQVGGKPLTRPEAVRHALKDWLTKHGYVPPKYPEEAS